MSARTRFIAQPKDKDSSKADGGGTDAPPRPRTDVSPTVPTDVRAPLNDSSNTPRLSHQSLHADDQAANISMTKNPTGAGNGQTTRGIDKPLNNSEGTVITNFTRIETFGSPNVHWLRLTVNPRNPNLFEVNQEILP